MPEPRVADAPDDTDRPVPLRSAPEGDGSPQDAGAARPDEPHGDDPALVGRREAERSEREQRSAGDDGTGEPSGSTRESGYSTERTQGAAQPGTSPDPG
jgi:hypothetical protein